MTRTLGRNITFPFSEKSPNLQFRDLINNAEMARLCSAPVWSHSESCEPLWLSCSCGQESEGCGIPGRNWRAASSWDMAMRTCERKAVAGRVTRLSQKEEPKPTGVLAYVKCMCSFHKWLVDHRFCFNSLGRDTVEGIPTWGPSPKILYINGY